MGTCTADENSGIERNCPRITLELQGKLAQLESQFAPSEAPSADALEALLNLGTIVQKLLRQLSR